MSTSPGSHLSSDRALRRRHRASATRRSPSGDHGRPDAGPSEPSGQHAATASRRPKRASQAGFLLIEVLLSAALIAIIAIATFTGLDAATRASSSEHARAQATQLAAQDEERLRGLTTTQLARLGNAPSAYEAENGLCVEKPSSTWRYCEKNNGAKSPYSLQTYTGTVFTITSSARFVAAKKEQLTCESTENAANYIQSTSEVTWTGIGTQHPVSQSSILTAPTTAGVEVKVVEQDEGPVSGAIAELTTAGGTTLTQITPASGCVIFGGLTATEKVTVKVSKSGWVSPTNETVPTTTVTVVASTITSTPTFTLAQTGSLEPEFVSNGETTFKVGAVTKPIVGDTFVASNIKLKPSSYYVGGTASTKTTNNSAAKVLLTGLYPFTKLKEAVWETEPYSIYAGDCPENSPETVAAITPPKVSVQSGIINRQKIEVPPVHIKVYEKESPLKLITSAESVKVTNAKCKATSSENLGSEPYEHYLALNSEGELEPKFLPYAKQLELCIVVKLASGKYSKYLNTAVENKAKAGVTLPNAYMTKTSATNPTITESSTLPTC